ncbi:MAG: hypothetical protein KC729_01750, partial [Candidatus Eisenbacteria bacterium]|nr:hypothetical protein [Candidatus Eisenbacteria bacterium]
APDERWGLDALAGRFVELSSGASTPMLTIAIGLVVQAQERAEPAVWIATGPSSFYPPDAAESGVDLEALPVIRVRGVLEGARAADIVLRSGAVTLAVLDLRDALRDDRGAKRDDSWSRDDSRSRKVIPGEAYSANARFMQGRWNRNVREMPHTERSVPPAVQTRLSALAQKHRSTLLCLTRKERGSSSLGSLVSLRAVGEVRKTAFDRFLWELEVLKDKHQAPGWSHSEACRGPAGLY